MAATRLYQFKLWCAVEAAWVLHWAVAEPNLCPHNPAHALDHARTTILDTLLGGREIVQVQEEPVDADTGGYFQAEDYEIDVPVSADPPARNLTWPYNVSLLAAWVAKNGDSGGDEVEVHVAPDTVLGALTVPAVAGAKVFSVSQTVYENMRRGFYATIGAEAMGRVVKVDAAAATVETELASAVDHAAGEYVKATVKMIPKIILDGASWRTVGESKIGGSLLKAGKVVRVIYRNKNLLAKKFRFGIELLY